MNAPFLNTSAPNVNRTQKPHLAKRADVVCFLTAALLATIMTSAAVIAAGVSFAVMMIVVLAFDIGIINKIPGNQAFYRFVRVPFNTAEQLDACLRQGRLCPAADPTANKCLYFEGRK